MIVLQARIPGLIFFRKFGNLYQTPGELNTIRPFIVGSAFLYGNTGVVLQNYSPVILI